MKWFNGIKVGATILLAMCSSVALAQGYPSKPVRIVVPFAAGGGGDMVIRALAARLSDQLKQPFIVENRVGAGGNIGSELVARSAPDGYTLLQGGDALTISKALYANLGYDPLKDLAPVVGISTGAHVLVAHPSFEANNLRELIALAKANPGKISYGTPGVGTGQDLLGAMFRLAAGIDIVAIPYKGGGALILDVLGGHTKVGVIGFPPVIAHLKSGKLKALAVTSAKRSPLLPNVESIAEVVPGLQSVQWIGLNAPAGTPDDVINKLAVETRRALDHPQMRELFASIGLEPFGLGPGELAKFMLDEHQAFAKVIKAAGIKAE